MATAAVLWDLDGTLVDSEPLHERTLVMSLQAEGIAPPPELHEMVVGLPAEHIHAEFRARHGLKAPFDAWRHWRNNSYRDHAAQLRARPGALEVYRALQQRGVAQAIVSNAERAIVEINLHAIGLTEPGLVSVSRNDVRCGKPDPESYRRAAWLLRVDAADATVVEDSPTGALAGLAAGCRTLLWPQAALDAPAGAIAVDDAAALRRLLDLG